MRRRWWVDWDCIVVGVVVGVGVVNRGESKDEGEGRWKGASGSDICLVRGTNDWGLGGSLAIQASNDAM